MRQPSLALSKGPAGREQGWIRAALSGPPELALAALLSEPRETGLTLGAALREPSGAQRCWQGFTVWGRVWQLEEVTRCADRALADTAVDLSVKWLVAEEIRRGKLPEANRRMLKPPAG